MPITYYTQEEYNEMKSKMNCNILALLKKIKKLENAYCMANGTGYECGSCDDKYLCPYELKYFSK